MYIYIMYFKYIYIYIYYSYIYTLFDHFKEWVILKGDQPPPDETMVSTSALFST